MDIALTLYGSLILTVLAFVLPILAILLSLFSDGTGKLQAEYANEKSQSEANIVSEVNKRNVAGNEIDLVALEKTISALKRKKRRAERRLTFLQPVNVALQIAVPFTLSLIAVISVKFVPWLWLVVLTLVVSVFLFAYGVFAIWNSFSVLTEAADVVSKAKRESDAKIVELLSRIVENTGDEKLFLDPKKVIGRLNRNNIVKGMELTFSANKKHKISVSIFNGDKKMAKMVELGLWFPDTVLIEKSDNFRVITTADKSQLVRFKIDAIQAVTDFRQGDICVTFLKSEEIDLATWISGENVAYQTMGVKIKVVE